MKKVTTTTIRIPFPMWIELRRLQEQGKIKSIHQAAIDGLKSVMKECRARKQE